MYKTSGSPSSQRAYNILRDFIIVASGKEYLDIGQLYAIIKPTIIHNLTNGWDDQNIEKRAMNSLGILLSEGTEATSLPRKCMLESADGAATRIAANGYYTSYNMCKIGSEQGDPTATFYIDNKYVSYLCLLFDSNLVTSILEVLSAEQPGNVCIEILKSCSSLLLTTATDEDTKIDILYFALKHCHEILEIVVKHLGASGQNVFTIDSKNYYIISVACFLYKINTRLDTFNILGQPDPASYLNANLPNIGSDLIDYNLDSLCHDNGKSKYYRIIMILVFILKNDELIIKRVLDEMYPGIFPIPPTVMDISGQIVNDEQMEALIRRFLGTASLSDLQKQIFYILGTKDYSNIELGLYTRLVNKSSYVFPVAGETLRFAIVNLKQSVKDAHGLAESKILPLSQLERERLLIPYNTNTAVDLRLKHDKSLAGTIFNTKTFNSEVWVTAVTRVDAAAQKTIYSRHYTEPIFIPIVISNLIDPTTRRSYTFIYKYIYGRQGAIQTVSGITCRDDDAICNTYKTLIDKLQVTNFYFRKSNISAVKNKADQAFQRILQNINQDSTAIPDLKLRNRIRDFFSRLIENAICGKRPQKGTCGDKSSKEEEIFTAKEDFINAINPYMIDDKVTPTVKVLINTTLYQILEITSKLNIELLEGYLRTLIPTTGSLVFNLSSAAAPTGVQGVQGSKGGKIPGATLGYPNDTVITQNNDNDLYNGYTKTNNFSKEQMVDLLPKKKDQSKLKVALAKGIKKPKIEPTTYTTLFGKYGFEIFIDANGENVLKPLNTDQEYNEYLQKYSLTTSQTAVEDTHMDTTEPRPAGGKIKTKKLRHKHKNKTRKGYKRQKIVKTSKRYTHRRLYKKNKTRSKR
jgi:hypothetical protein